MTIGGAPSGVLTDSKEIIEARQDLVSYAKAALLIHP
jgi:hypothetical protein